MNKIFLLFILLTFGLSLQAQSKLRPGFDPEEYKQLLKVSIRHMDSVKYPYKGLLAAYPKYKMVYESPVTGIYNMWQLWISPNNVGLVVIRGTVPKMESWMENFYSGMIPAQGRFRIDSNRYFDYKVAQDSNAYVHAGWMIGLAALAPDIVKQINHYYKKGVHDFIIFGHSQGGAIAFLLRSYLEYMQPALPRDITLKTYSSAAPKPGNLYYAYDYNLITRGGWGLRVVSTADWVPEMPFSIQSLSDVNNDSPFEQGKDLLNELPFFKRKYLTHVYNKLDKSSRKAQKEYTKYLGEKACEFIQKSLPAYEKPEFVNSFNYSTCGTPVILRPEKTYWENYYTQNKKEYGLFIHHHYYAYYRLVMYWYPERG
jgi:hypothetical protein